MVFVADPTDGPFTHPEYTVIVGKFEVRSGTGIGAQKSREIRSSFGNWSPQKKNEEVKLDCSDCILIWL